MANKQLWSIIILPSMWIIYVLFELLMGRITDFNTIIFNLIIVLFFTLLGFIFFKIQKRYNKGINYQKIFYVFTILLLTDQGIKLIIKLFFFDLKIKLIDSMLYFSPIINTNGSWLNARFGTLINFPLLILINLIAIFIFIEFYRYYIVNNPNDINADMCFIFVTCGALCSLIDKVFYGGSLDFIGISNLFIADIKDIYINIGLVFFIMTLINNDSLSSDDNGTFKDDINNIKKFISFIKEDVSTKFNK